MRTYPDFTWEYIVRKCEGLGNRAKDESKNLSSERQSHYLALSEVLLAVISKLREHPQLRELVPMMSLMCLRWFPSMDLEVDLYYNGTSYVIQVVSKSGFEVGTMNDGKAVVLEDVADEIYAYITKLRDD
jgi:hypothetical protein